MTERITNEYYEWLCNIVCQRRYSRQVSFDKLLRRLHDTPFRYTIPKDQNRASDGEDLRYRFVLDKDYNYMYYLIMDILNKPCSVLEMMVALAIHCEEDIMDDPAMGDRTAQWFWGMVTNLGLGSMIDDQFDIYLVDDILDRFLDREYSRDGKGGLFRIRDCDEDLRKAEIWHQLCWYLDSITDYSVT